MLLKIAIYFFFFSPQFVPADFGGSYRLGRSASTSGVRQTSIQRQNQVFHVNSPHLCCQILPAGPSLTSAEHHALVSRCPQIIASSSSMHVALQLLCSQSIASFHNADRCATCRAWLLLLSLLLCFTFACRSLLRFIMQNAAPPCRAMLCLLPLWNHCKLVCRAFLCSLVQATSSVSAGHCFTSLYRAALPWHAL